MASNSLPAAPDPEHIREIARSFWYSAILRAGIKLDVFNILEGGPLSSEALSVRIGADAKYVHAFLDTCVVLGLVEKRGDLFANTPVAVEHLVKGKEGYVGDHALHHTNTWASWGRLDEIIRDGDTMLPFETGFVDAPTYWTNYMLGQHNRAMTGQGRLLVDNVDLTGKRRMIDLGGGAASYSIALCEAYAELESVVVDQKEPVALARGIVEDHDLRGRISFLEGDFFELELGGPYDVVLISGVILIKSDDDCRRLLKLAHDIMAPGGIVIVQDYMRLEDDEARGRLDTLEHLYVMVAFDPGAGDREGEEVVGWLKDAGFTNTRIVPLPTQLGLVIAEKPV